MIDSKKSTASASSPNVISTEAQKCFNPLNTVPQMNRARSRRYLYGGMLFPSHIIEAKEVQSLKREGK